MSTGQRAVMLCGWGKGGKVTAAGWQVTLCDPIWHVISRSGEVISITNCCIRFAYLLSLSPSWFVGQMTIHLTYNIAGARETVSCGWWWVVIN